MMGVGGRNWELCKKHSKSIYTATREVKSWPVQSTCKLPPEPKATLFIPMKNMFIYFKNGNKRAMQVYIPIIDILSVLVRYSL